MAASYRYCYPALTTVTGYSSADDQDAVHALLGEKKKVARYCHYSGMTLVVVVLMRAMREM